MSLHSVLTSPTEPNATALARLHRIVDVAGSAGLSVDLTGANVMRPDRVPGWLLQATDAELRQAHRTFWASCAREFCHSTVVLSFNLVNEPIIPTKPTSVLATGCLGDGPSAFAPGCNDTLCYCNYLRRTPSQNRTTNRAWVQGWCREMSAAIKAEAPSIVVTLGDLALSMGGAPTCTVADGLDYYSLHLYPSHPANASLEELADFWRGRIAALPADGGPVVVEEMYPLGGPPGVSGRSLLQTYLNATEPRARGWMSFYWGTAVEMRMSPMGAALYNAWLGAFAAGRPW